MIEKFIKPERFQFVDGIYLSADKPELAFPKEGLNRNYTVEEQSFWHRHRYNCVKEMIDNFPPKDNFVVDVGGGNGYMVHRMQSDGYKAALYEPDGSGILNAKARGVKTLVCGLFNEANIKEKSVPAVGLFDVLEHIEDDGAFLRAIAWLLQEGGKLYLTVPAHQRLWSRKDEYNQHFRRYSLDHLCALVEANGFDLVYSTYIFGFLYLPMVLKRGLWKLKAPSSGSKSDTSFNQEYSEEHKLGAAERFIRPFMRAEIKKLRDKKTLRQGASCLIVATPKAGAF